MPRTRNRGSTRSRSATSTRSNTPQRPHISTLSEHDIDSDEGRVTRPRAVWSRSDPIDEDEGYFTADTDSDDDEDLLPRRSGPMSARELAEMDREEWENRNEGRDLSRDQSDAFSDDESLLSGSESDDLRRARSKSSPPSNRRSYSSDDEDPSHLSDEDYDPPPRRRKARRQRSPRDTQTYTHDTDGEYADTLIEVPREFQRSTKRGRPKRERKRTTSRRDFLRPPLRTSQIPTDDLTATSGESLQHIDGSVTKSASEANSSWNDNTKVSQKEARRYQKRHQGKRFNPSMALRHPTVSSTRSALRKTNPDAKDLSCMPLPEHKRNLRVAYDLDWSKNHWKTDFVPEGHDKEKAWCASLLPNMDSVVTRHAIDLLRKSQISMVPEDLDEDEEQWLGKRLKLLKVADKNKKAGKELTDEMKSLIVEADSAHAPTTAMTMEDDFKSMFKHGLSNADAESERVKKLLPTLSTEEKRELEKEMALFEEKGLVRQEDLYDAGYDMLADHGTLSWMSTDKYTKNYHASDILSMMIDGKTVICKNEAARRKFLDNGKDVDVKKSVDFREFMMEDRDRVAEREYLTDSHMPTTVTDDDTVEYLRQNVIKNYDKLVAEITESLKDPGGEAPRDAHTADLDLSLQREGAIADFRSSLKSAEKQKDPRYRNFYQDQAVRALAKANRKIDKTNYFEEEEWEALYPTIAKYKTYNDAEEAGSAYAVSGLGRKWWHESNEAQNMKHKRLQPGEKGK